MARRYIGILAATLILSVSSLAMAQSLPANLQPRPTSQVSHSITTPMRPLAATSDSHPYWGATLGILYATTALAMCCQKGSENPAATKYYIITPIVVAASIPTMMPDGWRNRDRFLKTAGLGYGVEAIGAALTASDPRQKVLWPLWMVAGHIAITGWWSNRQ